MLLSIQEKNVMRKDRNFILVTVSLWFIKKGRLLEQEKWKKLEGRHGSH